MACRHLVSLYLLTHLSKLRFVIIFTDTISAIAAITHQILFKCSTNSFEYPPEWSMLSELNKGFDRCAVHIFCICPWHLPQNTVYDREMSSGIFIVK